MPTPAERTALLFLAGVLLAGGLVRVGRAVSGGVRPEPTAARALDAQRGALDSAAAARRTGRGRTPPSSAPRARAAPAAGRGAPPATDRVNVNRASASELERLPRIGPAIATRIVEEREARGPFGSIGDLESRVRGVGPALARTIEPHVTFLPR